MMNTSDIPHHPSANIVQRAKSLVRNYQTEFDTATEQGDMVNVLKAYTSDTYVWRGMHPFYEQKGAKSIVSVFWHPLKCAFSSLRRREDFFFSGQNNCTEGEIWVISAGNFLGLFDTDWLGIRSTGKMTFLPYAEFHRIENDTVVETALFLDILSIMHQAEQYPLPPMTGAACIKPGPRTHDGVLVEPQDDRETQCTMELVNEMINELDRLNKNGVDIPNRQLLAKHWHDDMIWFGPMGIGASYTIARYQQQHQYPFRENLTDKIFKGHVARFAEGKYACFFGWPNLTNKNKGNFMGLPSSGISASMRVVDIYRRDGDRLAENWIYIDLLHYLHEQGLDVLERMKTINRT